MKRLGRMEWRKAAWRSLCSARTLPLLSGLTSRLSKAESVSKRRIVSEKIVVVSVACFR